MSSVCVLVPETEHPDGLVEYPDATAEELPGGMLVVSRGTVRLAEFPPGRYQSWSLEGEPAPASAEAKAPAAPEADAEPGQEPAPAGA